MNARIRSEPPCVVTRGRSGCWSHARRRASRICVTTTRSWDTFRAAGFSLRAAGHAYALLDAFVYGFALQEEALPFDAASAPDVAGAMLNSTSATHFPNLVAFMRDIVLPGGYDFADEFGVGLTLVLDGVSRLRSGPGGPQ